MHTDISIDIVPIANDPLIPIVPISYRCFMHTAPERVDELEESVWSAVRRKNESQDQDCQERRCTTELHGGDLGPTSTPHRSGIKTKKKKLTSRT